MSATDKQKQILRELKASHMSLYRFFGSETQVNHQHMKKLLHLLRTHTRPVRPELLGVIGEEHLRRMMEDAGGEPKSIKYSASPGPDADGLPYLVEIATCPFKKWVDGKEETPGRMLVTSNYVANVDALHYVTPRISLVTLTPEHILASGSLPPAFPMTVIDGVPYWDGGLFDNTPIEAMIDLLDNEEIDHLPIFVVDLFATHAEPPANLAEVQERMTEISFESRFLLHHADADGSLTEFTTMLEEIERDLPSDSPRRERGNPFVDLSA